MSNEYIQPENYWAGYQDSIDNLKNKPEGLEFTKLCYLVFETEQGKELMKVIDERIINANLVPISTQNYETVSTYYEGFKEAFRTIKMHIKSHEQFIENNKGT